MTVKFQNLKYKSDPHSPLAIKCIAEASLKFFSMRNKLHRAISLYPQHSRERQYSLASAHQAIKSYLGHPERYKFHRKVEVYLNGVSKRQSMY